MKQKLEQTKVEMLGSIDREALSELKDVSTNIVFVDDDQITNFIHRKIVLKHLEGVEVETYDNAKKLIDEIIVEKKRPSLIVLDLNMPFLDGWTFMDKMVANEIHIPTIILTSSFNTSDKEKSLEYTDVLGFIMKPLKLNELFEIVFCS